MEMRTVVKAESVESDNVVIVVSKRKPRKVIACANCRMLGFRCICTKEERIPVYDGSTKASRKEERQKARLLQGLPTRPLPPNPTEARPGSLTKIAVMEERERQGFQLHHPLDYRLPTETLACSELARTWVAEVLGELDSEFRGR